MFLEMRTPYIHIAVQRIPCQIIATRISPQKSGPNILIFMYVY